MARIWPQATWAALPTHTIGIYCYMDLLVGVCSLSDVAERVESFVGFEVAIVDAETTERIVRIFEWSFHQVWLVAGELLLGLDAELGERDSDAAAHASNPISIAECSRHYPLLSSLVADLDL